MSARRLVLTGASGYIGRRLVEIASDRGCQILALGSAPSSAESMRAIPWRLGDEPPIEALDGAAAVIHLGHSWISDSTHGVSAANVNLAGSERLAKAALAAGVGRFVFASTTSARPGALNAYGRIKHAVEERLRELPEAQLSVVCARIGLVYGGRELAQYGLLSKLVRMTPILPMIGIDREVQPIHLDEVCAALLALAIDPLPPRDGISPRTFVLAAPEPVTFGDWLRLLRFAQTGKRLLLVPVPTWSALFACDLSRFVPFAPTIGRERVLGLSGTAPMDSRADLAALKISVVAPSEGLASIRPVRRRKVAEAIAMLSYVAGHRITSAAAIARLIRGIGRGNAQPLGLPGFALACPPMLRAFEPLHARHHHRFAQRLHLAAMVVESMHEHEETRRPNIVALVAQAALEVVALPFRLVLGRRFA